jgi:predicted TIM-barrel fold metal-dependent hydrolase
MIIDVHTHLCAMTPGRGSMSRKLLNKSAFRFMRWRLGIEGEDRATEDQLTRKYIQTIREAGIDAAVLLAFDAVYTEDGRRDEKRTHLYLSNDYARELSLAHPEILFGASVHPYRKDALQELERCIAGGCVLVKWLPLTQDFDPADPRCIPLYEAMAHHGVPLLSHTGGEQALMKYRKSARDPGRLEEALRRGVKVIMAHCGTRGIWGETDYFESFSRLAREYEHCYGDTAALCLPSKWHALLRVLDDESLRAKMVHGSDWPIICLPPVQRLGLRGAMDLWREPNWMKRDVLTKRRLGFDEAYWQRAAGLLRLPPGLKGASHAAR